MRKVNRKLAVFVSVVLGLTAMVLEAGQPAPRVTEIATEVATTSKVTAPISHFVLPPPVQMGPRSPNPYEPADDAIKCAELTVYHESRGLSVLGQKMVVHTLVQRVKKNRSYWGGNTICGVALHKNIVKRAGRLVTVCMFAWLCNPKIRDAPIREPDAMFLAREVVKEVFSGEFTPPEGFEDADSYHDPKHSSKNGKKGFEGMEYLGTIDVHQFYVERRA